MHYFNKSMEEKITLERDVFKALASDTRVQILKLLNIRRHTQSELAVSLNLSIPTVKEHLDAMEKAGLVKPVEEGYKWKYYELTEKSKCILDPERKKVWILLGFWVAAAAGTIFVFTSKFLVRKANLASQEAMPKATPVLAAAEATFVSKPFPWVEFFFIVIFSILTILLIYFIFRSKLFKKHK